MALPWTRSCPCQALLDLIHESEFERLRGYASRRLLEGPDVPDRYRFRALHKSGRAIWVEQFVRVIEWDGQKFIHNTIIDVDESGAEGRRASTAAPFV